MAVSRAQVDALISIHRDPGDYPGVQIREPTKAALVRMGLAYRVPLPNGITNGEALRLTEAGRKAAEANIKARALPPVEDDLMAFWESYD